jgi:tetratricopeptide (TPR) repeat protein
MDDFVREHAGLAFFTVGEVLRLTGDLDGAQEAFRQADELGRSPQPGLALVLLARGDTAGALAALRQALAAEPWNQLARTRLLAAVVDVCLATGDTAGAAQAAAELAAIAATFATTGLQAAADYAEGAVALGEGRAGAAVAALDRSWQRWRQIGASHEAARARLRLGVARCAGGDHAGGLLDVGAAQASFERLGARPDADEAARLSATLPAGPSGVPA